MLALTQGSILQADDRGSRRYQILVQANTEPLGPGAAAVTIHDISSSGLLFQTDAQIAADAQILLEIPGLGVLAAEVVWESGCFRGAQFQTRLTDQALITIYDQSKVVWPEFRASNAESRAVSPPNAAIGSASAQSRAAQPTLSPATRIQAVILISVALWACLGFAAATVHQTLG